MVRNLINRSRESFLQLNLYKKPSSDDQTTRKEQYATRVYIGSLTIIILVIIIVCASIARAVNKTEYSPSHTRFSLLASKYPNTIHCPCSKIGIGYDIFTTTQVHFHQVCSSRFVQQTWIDMVYDRQNNSSILNNEFFTTLSFFWQVIAGFCDVSNRTWTDIEAGFRGSYTFNPVAVTEQVTRTQAQATLNDIISSAQATLNRNLLAIRRIASANQVVSALGTNYYLRYPPGNSSSSTRPEMSSRTFGNCSCLRSEGCPHVTTFHDVNGNLITVPGITADCLLMDGVLASTLECYYNQSCLSLLQQSLSIVMEPLSNDLNKHFTINSTVEMLLNEIMIDEMTTDIQFNLFYSQCNPVYCSYSYAHRLDVLFMVTTILSIFGGLSFALRLIAPFIATIVLWWKNRNTATNNVPGGEPVRQRKRKP